MSNLRATYWCFTDNKFTDFQKYTELYTEYSDIIRYIIVGKEIAPTTGKMHGQGFIQFKTKRRFNTVKKTLPPGVHLSTMKARDSQQAADYCKKDNHYKEYGTHIKQGQRTDLEQTLHEIKHGATDYEIASNHGQLFVQYGKRLQHYRQVMLQQQTKQFRKLTVEYVYGTTGTGKTRSAVEESKEDYFMIQGDQMDWWDGYQGEKHLIIDEYSNQVPITKLLNYLDGYQLRLPIKGGFTYAAWDKVTITSNLQPGELHPNAKPEHQQALTRRIHKWTHKSLVPLDLFGKKVKSRVSHKDICLKDLDT